MPRNAPRTDARGVHREAVSGAGSRGWGAYPRPNGAARGEPAAAAPARRRTVGDPWAAPPANVLRVALTRGRTHDSGGPDLPDAEPRGRSPSPRGTGRLRRAPRRGCW